MSLCRLHTNIRIGSGTSVARYLTDYIDHGIARVQNGQLPQIEISDCFSHRALVRYAVRDAAESSMFAISHGNLAAHKIIVDENYNITG